jgi:hypothetical protein
MVALPQLQRPRPRSAYVRFTSILLKNSNFGVDHNSEDRWQPRRKIPGGLTRFAACDLPVWLAVTTTSLDDAMRAGTRFSQLVNLRVFQQYPSTPAIPHGGATGSSRHEAVSTTLSSPGEDLRPFEAIMET